MLASENKLIVVAHIAATIESCNYIVQVAKWHYHQQQYCCSSMGTLYDNNNQYTPKHLSNISRLYEHKLRGFELHSK